MLSPFKGSCVFPSDPQTPESLRDSQGLSSLSSRWMDEHCAIHTHRPTSASNTLTHPPDTQQYPDVLIYFFFLFFDSKWFLTSVLHHSHMSATLHLTLNSTLNYFLIGFSFQCVMYFLLKCGRGISKSSFIDGQQAQVMSQPDPNDPRRVWCIYDLKTKRHVL